MPSNNLGNLIRQKRERKHLTVAHAAELCGISDRGLALIEFGDSDPRLSSVLKIATALEINLGDIEGCKQAARSELSADHSVES